MDDRKRNNLHVVRPDEEDAEKSRESRRRILRIVLIAALVAAAAIVTYILVVRNIKYDDYTVTDEADRSDTSATHYMAFGDGYVKYSNDGASYVTVKDVTVWNQSYEMENPMVSSCGTYIAFADRQGETVYVLNEEGLQGEISLVMPISRIDVASQGTVAVLTSDSTTGYLSLFDKGGAQIAEGAIHVENTGTPMDIALSEDAKNLAVAIVDVSSGTARTTINFYNFSSAGQNQIDNLVGAFQYEDTIIPEIEYTESDMLVAFGDNGIYVFEGTSYPAETGRLETEDEIQSVFYDDTYFGLVYSSAAKDGGRDIYVYDSTCRERALIETDFSYDSIQFLDNHEICLLSTDRCDIYTLSGELKFSHEFDDEVMAVFHRNGYRRYMILMEGSTERVRLKIFGNRFGGGDSEDELVWEAVEETESITGAVAADVEEEVETEEAGRQGAEEEEADREETEAEEAEREEGQSAEETE